MSHPSAQIPYLLIFRSPDAGPTRPEGELPENFAVWMAWIDGLKAKGLSLGGHPLEDEGRVLRPRDQPATDGPFAEGKEVVGGTLIILAPNLDEACEIGRGCPGLNSDISVEVRRLMTVPERFARTLC